MSVKDERIQVKLINTSLGWRVSQACDRCRIKKIKCDGNTPCRKCAEADLECVTSDKLQRRLFPKGYTSSLEARLKELENENMALKAQLQEQQSQSTQSAPPPTKPQPTTTITKNNNTIHINNPIDQIFNLDKKGVIIGNDNLNFELQFNHLLINLNLPFLKITNSHNFLLNDPDAYLYHPLYTKYNEFHNKDLDVIYNPVTSTKPSQDSSANTQLPLDVYDLFIKLINNFKQIFNLKKELDNQIVQFFVNYNTFIPIFDYTAFMESYDAFHTMYPFMFTYDDATINGFNISQDGYQVVNQYLMVVIQIYAMIMMSDPSLNMNLLLNHSHPNYSFGPKNTLSESVIRSLYDFLPYLNVFYVLVNQLQTYLLFFYYSLLTNNKEKSLFLSALINAFIGVLGINLNSKYLFFNDLSLSPAQKAERVKIFWGFKVLLKCFNLKFGFKPSINTTVINPVTIDRYFSLTPEKLSVLLDSDSEPLFQTLLRPSVEFLNLMNLIIPSSFSPNYYQYLKHDRQAEHQEKRPSSLEWILNDDDGDGNDGNLNYNYTQFLQIDKNLSNWRYALKEKTLNLMPLHQRMGLPVVLSVTESTLYERLTFDSDGTIHSGLSDEGVLSFAQTGLPDIETAGNLIKMQLNFHYLLIRSLNYLNFVIDRELTQSYYVKIANISREVLAYFILVFEHVGQAEEHVRGSLPVPGRMPVNDLSIDIDDDGFVINDFSVKRRKTENKANIPIRITQRAIPLSPFNLMLNGLSLTVINIKKSIVLQMLYLLICLLKVSKKGGVMSNDTVRILNRSIVLFIRIFVNYRPNANKFMKTKKVKEDDLFLRIINDELETEILKEKKGEDSEEEDEDDIDWDDEDMDEDLKYLKTLKYIKYKTNLLYEKSQQRQALQKPLEMERRKSLGVHLPPLIPNVYNGQIQQGSPPLLAGFSPPYPGIKMESREDDLKKDRSAIDLMALRQGKPYAPWQG